MSKVQIVLNLQGINDVMKGAHIRQALQNAGDAVASAASGMAGGEPFAASTHFANWIAIANVFPQSDKAANAVYSDNVLLKAIGNVGLPTDKGG